MNRRMRVYLVVVIGLLAAFAVMSLRHLASARATARAAGRDLADCRRFERQIERLRAQPAMAADRERRSAELSAPIEQAARAAGVPPDRLLRISPEPAQRLGETAYKEKPTRVFLKNVRLRELVAMVHALGAPETGLDLKSLRLTAPSRDATEGTWSAELVLVYLVYEPREVRL